MAYNIEQTIAINYRDNTALTAAFCMLNPFTLDFEVSDKKASPENVRKCVEAYKQVRTVRANLRAHIRAFLETLPEEVEKLEAKTLQHCKDLAAIQTKLHTNHMQVLRQREEQKRAEEERRIALLQEREREWHTAVVGAANRAVQGFYKRFYCDDETFQVYFGIVCNGLSEEAFRQRNEVVEQFVGEHLAVPLKRSENDQLTRILLKTGYMQYVIYGIYVLNYLKDDHGDKYNTFAAFLITQDLKDVYVDGLFDAQTLVLGWNDEAYWDRIWKVLHGLISYGDIREHVYARTMSFYPHGHQFVRDWIDVIAPAYATVSAILNRPIDGQWRSIFNFEGGPNYPSTSLQEYMEDPDAPLYDYFR